jgi:hypothetical protein
MQNDRSIDVVRSSNSQPQPSGNAGYNSLQQAFDDPVQLTPQPTGTASNSGGPRRKLPWRLIIIVGASILLLIGGIIMLLNRASQTVQLQAGEFGKVDLPLNGLEAATLASNNTAKTLKVNGQLQVSNSLVLTPGAQPSSAVAGQMYYDQTSNQLNYYNGQQFVNVGGTTNNVTNVTNFLSGTGNGVQLQGSSPGTQQNGNFNVSGVGKVGSLSTTVITSNGGTLYVNPVSATSQQQIAAGTPATAGLAAGSASAPGPGWNNDLSATKITLGSVGGSANSITVFFTGGTGTSHVQVGLYDDDGNVPSRPGNLLANSAVTTLTPNGFTTLTIPSINLAANTTYWLGVNTDDATVGRTYNAGSKASCFASKGFGFMPDPFGGCFFDDNVYTIYLNYTVGGGAAGGISQAQFSLGANGQALFQNTSDSTNAFQVQNAAGSTTILNIDTINGRVGIGKITPAYKLDIAGGDINLSNGRSVRFGGLQALSTNGDGSVVSVTNFVSGGTISNQAANFVIQDANATNVLFTADAANFKITIGNPAGDNNPVVLYLANKNTAGDPVGAEGGTYYNSTLGSFRCFYSGFWHNCADAEPQHSFAQYDEFLGGSTSFSGSIGSLAWTPVAIGANGSLAINPATPAPNADRPGVLRVRTPAVANQGTTLMLGDNTAGSITITKDNDVKTAVAVGAATNQVLRVGLHNQTNTTTQPVSGVWWEANPAANANWRYCYGDGATATCAVSTIAITANAWATLEARVTATGAGTSAATFVINNTPFTVSGVTIDTTNPVSPAYSCYTTAGSAQDCFWDYFQLTGTTSARR